MTRRDEAAAVAMDGASALDAAVARAERRRRRLGRSVSFRAQAEPLVWLTGGGLVLCLAMVVGLLLLILYQGTTTFWPGALVELRTLAGRSYLGEVTRRDRYELSYASLGALPEPERAAAAQLLDPRFHQRLERLLPAEALTDQLLSAAPAVERAVRESLERVPAVREMAPRTRLATLEAVSQALRDEREALTAAVAQAIAESITGDTVGTGVSRLWRTWQDTEDAWCAQADWSGAPAALTIPPDVRRAIWGHSILAWLSRDVSVNVPRQLVRTGNYELTNEHFTWISDFQLAPEGVARPEWAVVFERLAWGRFYGVPRALLVDGATTAATPGEVWQRYLELHPQVRARWKQRRQLELVDTGNVNRRQEEARLHLRQVELQAGPDSPAWRDAQAAFEQLKAELDEQFTGIRQQIDALDQENSRYTLVVATADGQEKQLALADIVRAYPANRLTWVQKCRIYVARWGEFLADDPREANSEGGVFPAIWGTVVMTLLMSLAVVPFGVLAALYLREYARAGLLVSTVRIAVNNLAGVPSIVFGVFGLGFFCYVIGASVDQHLFAAKLPSPTFGTGGLMWASLTLALLTLPVVIVATEEALAAVPLSMREGSLACGATKWQTLRRIVLPRAMPGIITGMILAMARGAGEVAPLMLVGAVKLAPELPVDGTFPFVHLERSFMHLGFHIYDLGFQSQNSEAAKPMVFTTTLLLIVLIALMNLIAIGLRARLRRRYTYSQF
jgi:phosphate transport system permease protein